MGNNEFVTYLNTLHNYNAQNSNVFGEKNIKSKFYDQVMVDIPICDYIVKQLTNSPSHIMILTGHAGDGKTSLMYQVMNKLNQSFDPMQKEFCISLPNGKDCLCIKDFSEFSDEAKVEVMKRVAIQQQKGNYVFLVANTGPLINNFPQAFEIDKKEIVQTKLIELLDSNTGEIEDVFGLKLCVINVVAINNSFFQMHLSKK